MLVGNHLCHLAIHTDRDTGRKDAVLDEERQIPTLTCSQQLCAALAFALQRPTTARFAPPKVARLSRCQKPPWLAVNNYRIYRSAY